MLTLHSHWSLGGGRSNVNKNNNDDDVISVVERANAWKILLLNSLRMVTPNVEVDLYVFATAECRWTKRLTFVISLMKHNQNKNTDCTLMA